MGLESQSPSAPIAVVGISCRLPGSSNSPDELWKFLSRGGEAWSPVPEQRFNGAAFNHPHPDDPNGTSHHQGGHFIDSDVRDFDNSFFHLSPQQAAAMDPQQRFLLEMSYEALENAGWGIDQVAGSSTSVYAATFTNDYERNLNKDVLDLPVYYSTGTEKAILANRISHYFDLHGPSMTLDTACSGGLVALHQACQSLRDRESSASIVAAANLTLSPDQHIGMSKLHLVGGTGRSFPFDDRGTGYGRGEGCVVLVLKLLDDALRDRDPVRVVIRGTAVNQDGHTPSGITYPNGKAQADLIRTAYTRTCLRPQDVPYVEAHGTGTVAGDTEELNALAEVFSTPARSLPLYVGSIKGNIGHGENVSGLASFVKATLILDHQLVPPVAGFANPKPGLPLDKMNIPTTLTPLPVAPGTTPTVSINSFGFGGTNSHAILQRGPRSVPTPSEESPRLFILSAHNEASLTKMMQDHLDWLENEPCPSLADLSYTLCHRRSSHNWRFGCVAEHKQSLIEKLQRGLSSRSFKRRRSDPYIIFVFTGQGAQWAGMGRELFNGPTSSVIFQQSIRKSRKVLTSLGADWNLEEELVRDATETRLNSALLAQPATTAIQIALVELLRTQGIRPRIVVGHSSGEIAAAYAAGRISHRAALSIAYHRGCVAGLKRDLPRGAMMSVGLGEHEVEPFMEGLEGRAGIACVNSPSNVTVSGDGEAIDTIDMRLAASTENIFHRKLIVDTAYHSHHMQAVAEEYLYRLDQLRDEGYDPQYSDISFISSVSGSLKTDNFDSAYWTANLVSKVRFCDAIQALARHRLSDSSGQDALFIEIGPHNSLAGPVRQSISAIGLPRVEFDYYSALQRKTSALASVLSLASNLFESGAKFQLEAITNLCQGLEAANTCSNLPSYPWDHSTKHWHESRVTRQYLMRPDPYHDLLGVRAADSTPIEPRWRHMICLNSLPWLAHHVVDGVVVFPGSGYLCMVNEAIRQVCRERTSKVLETITLRNVSFHRALVVPNLPQRLEMQLSFDPRPNTSLEFAFRITACTENKWNEYCSGLVGGRLAEAAETTPAEIEAEDEEIQDGLVLESQALYAELAEMGNAYGPSFSGINSLVIYPDQLKARSIVQIPDTAALMPASHQAAHLIHPSTLDILLHTALPLVRRKLGRGSVVPTYIEEVTLSVTAATSTPSKLLTALTELTAGSLRTAYASLSVTSGGTSVLAATGIEMRSLGIRADADESSSTEGICYELEWKPDYDFISTSHSSSRLSRIEDLIGHICFKSSAISVLELGTGNEELAITLINAVNSQGGRLLSYDLINGTAEHTAALEEKFAATSVPFSILSPSTGHDFESQHYDVVLVSNAHMLTNCSSLKPDGILLAQVKASAEINTWCAAAQEAQLLVDVDMTLNGNEESSILVTRPKEVNRRENMPLSCLMLTPSKEQLGSGWHQVLRSRVEGICSKFTIVDIYADLLVSGQQDTCILVVDDQDQPILSDPECFDTVTKLLNLPVRIVWLSPDSPISMHQITGVSRTAHSENDKLRLTTIHAPLERFNSEELMNLVVYSLQRLNRTEDPCREREYWMSKDGTVLIPRLYPSEELSHAVADNEEVKVNGFDQNHTSSKPLDTYEIEIDTEAYSLSKHGLTGGLWEYVGVVSEVGSSVKEFAPGDRVVAISSLLPTNCIRISQDAASRVPLSTPPTFSALLLHLAAACHVLHKLADLPPSATVWVHEVRSPLGRAILATAQSIGIRCITSASTASEARELGVQLRIPEQDVLVSHKSLSRRILEDVCVNGLDAIILTGEEIPPAGVVAQLKPFGCVVVMAPSSRRDEQHFKLPSNAAMYQCDITELLRCRPETLKALMNQVSVALKYVHMDGLNIYKCERQTAKVLRKAESGALVVVINRDSQTSTVAACNNTIQERWHRRDASYIIVGGLGDLGKRLMVLMAHRGAKHLITLSRRLPSDEDQINLQRRLSDIDPECRLYCIPCDLTCEKSVQDAAATLSRDGIPPVRGVIHSAAVLEDRPLSFMTFHDFRTASQVKVDGTIALERAFASPSLEFFIMLSSAVNIVGASGQANYNAGNAVQDALAQVRQERHCRYISLNIGWIQDAVHTADNEARLAGLSRVGLRPIKTDELRRFFDYVLANAYSTDRQLTQAIIGFNSDSLSNTTTHNGTLISPLFVHVRPNIPATTNSGSQDKAPPTATSFKQVLAVGDHAAVLDFINSAICNQLSKLTSVDTARINADQSILELGLDSLIAIELRNWLTRTFDCPLQPSEILDNQTVRTLGEKVASRSHLCLDPSPHGQNGTISQVNGNGKMENPAKKQSNLSPLPVPSLEETLRRFEESRQAVDSISEQEVTARQVQAFIKGIGPILQEKIEGFKPSDIASSYERQIYLMRREPLQDYSEFTVGHPVDAPTHSQSLRAAIVTVAAAEFARKLTAGDIPIDTLNGLPVTGEARNWLFWATRRPGAEVDHMERFTPSDTVVVLRRGHVFQLNLSDSNAPLRVAAVQAAFDDIMSLSEEPSPYVCTLTAGNRQSWFLARRELELEPENSATLTAIDSAMFIICLDDESPTTSGERHTQFLIGGNPFANRWLDKPVQFAVTANGLSAGIYEHSKVDGLDVRMLHRHIVRALFRHDNMDTVDFSASVTHYTIHQHAWKTSPGVLSIMDSVKLQCGSYGHIDHLYFMAEELGLNHLRSHRVSPHATAHIVALLAVYLVDKKIRPAWEIVSLANFASGRLDWVQTVSPAIRSFLEKAAPLVASNDYKEEVCRFLRSDLFIALKGYSQALSTAARGQGYVRHLYALQGTCTETLDNVNTDMPDLFHGHAWNSTRRDGLHQNFKIGFMPEDDSDYPHSWDEGGFLMDGNEGVYIHCGIREHGIAFAVSAYPEYASQVCKNLGHASKLISLVL